MKLGCLLPFGAMLLSGCIMVYVDGRGAHNAGVNAHEQNGSNLVNNASVPVPPKFMDQVANELTGIKGIDASGNSATIKAK